MIFSASFSKLIACLMGIACVKMCSSSIRRSKLYVYRRCS